jgi:hypothetical protein
MNQTQHMQDRGSNPQHSQVAGLTAKELEAIPESVLRWMARHAKGDDLATIGGALSDRHLGALPVCRRQRDLVQQAREATDVEEMKSIGRAWRQQLLRSNVDHE